MINNQLTPEQIKAAFAICLRPVKLLIKEFFVQFSNGTAKLKNGNIVPNDKIPEGYLDQGKLMEMDIDTSMFDFNSLLRIPDSAGYLEVGKKENNMWKLTLELGGYKRTFDKKTLDEFKEGAEPTPEDAHRRVMELMMGFYPSARVVFDYLKTQNPIMKTLTLTYNPGACTIIISDSQFPGLRAGKVLYVKLAEIPVTTSKNTVQREETKEVKKNLQKK